MEPEQNRTEPATPFKLSEARRRGPVAKSVEVNSFLMLVAALGLVAGWGDDLVYGHAALDRGVLAGIRLEPDDLRHLIASLELVLDRFADLMAPPAVALITVGIVANVIQSGPVLSVFPLKPDFARINPVNGLKRLFSLRLLYEAGKTVLKLAVMSAMVLVVLYGFVRENLGANGIHPAGYPAILLDAVVRLLATVLLLFVLVAIIDWLFSRWDFGRQMRMSRRELKDEAKRREGDPDIRSRIRELRREALERSRSVRRIPDADVLITNPAHVAVALAYRRGEMRAPKVIAKGADRLVEKMREIARRSAVPIVESPRLARTLFTETPIEREIPPETFPQVASIFARRLVERGRERPDVVAETHPPW